jgi:cytochrome c biogenesis protein CcmG/thiol:disulfide interchange protein DsbE
MKKNIIYLTIVFFIIFIFTVFYKGLYKKNVYTPNELNNNNFVQFSSKDLFSEVEINSSDLISNNKFTIINIWSSWCMPCRIEHPFLMELSHNSKINLVGLNYKDRSNNAKKFINDFGNPYSIILIDPNGTISIELGAYGVPETFIVNKDQKIVKKFIGPLAKKNLKEIEKIVNR